jgi:hypothetical protein
MALQQDTTLWYAQDGLWTRAGRYSHTAGAVVAGFYKASGGDFTNDIATYDLHVTGQNTYVSWGSGAAGFPRTAWMDTLSKNGVIANYVWEPKLYTTPPGQYPQPNGKMGYWTNSVNFYSWTQVTSGALDQLFNDVADAVKALPYNINIQICSERDTDHQFGGTINGVSYTYAQLDALSVTGVSYIINHFKNRGVTNATFSAGMAGFSTDGSLFARCYCPDVDIVQFNCYNHGTWRTAETNFFEQYALLNALPGGAASKPVWIAEWGCDADVRRPAYFRSVPAVIAKLPRIKFMAYFNSTVWGTIDPSDTASWQGLKDCYDDPLFGGTG